MKKQEKMYLQMKHILEDILPNTVTGTILVAVLLAVMGVSERQINFIADVVKTGTHITILICCYYLSKNCLLLVNSVIAKLFPIKRATQ